MIPRPRFSAALLLALGPASLAAQRALDLTGKPVASVAEAFTKVSGVQELSPTLAVATDNMEAKVVLADFARGTVKQIGSKGRGPNEYLYPSPPVRAPNGVYVFDTYQRRAIVIDHAGAIAGMKTMPDAGGLDRVRGSDDAGRFYFEGSDFDPNTGGFSDSLPIARWDPATGKVETMTRVYGGGRVMIRRSTGNMSLAREITPFPNMDAWVAMPDGRIAVLQRAPYRINLAVGRSTVAGDSIPWSPVVITAAERNAYRERNTPARVGASMIGGGTGPQSAGTQWEDASFPATMPPFIAADVVRTPEGEIWIPRSFSLTGKTRRYDIYDANRKLVGSATLNANARVVGFGAKSVYVARVNPDDDLVYLDKYGR